MVTPSTCTSLHMTLEYANPFTKFARKYSPIFTSWRRLWRIFSTEAVKWSLLNLSLLRESSKWMGIHWMQLKNVSFQILFHSRTVKTQQLSPSCQTKTRISNTPIAAKVAALSCHHHTLQEKTKTMGNNKQVGQSGRVSLRLWVQF